LEENNKKNETVNIISQLNNTEVIHEVDNLEHEKQKFKNIFDTMLHTVSSLEELDVLKKCLSSAQPTLLALRNNINKKPFKKMSINISPKNKKIIHQRRFFSTKKTKKHTKKTALGGGGERGGELGGGPS